MWSPFLSTSTGKTSEWLAIYQAGSKATEISNNLKGILTAYLLHQVIPKSYKSMLSVVTCSNFMKASPKL